MSHEYNPIQIEEARDEAREKERRRIERQDNDLRQVISRPEGRRLLWRLLGECGIYRAPDAGRHDETYKNIGRGDIGRMILSELLRVKPEAWLQMQREAYSDSKREE